ncbi:GNAT family N-acetyltransferase [Campylobacter sp. MOP51]|uniref:GNAT family N-acetyltransferase n=1 Tax=Campylobacter canis TaxID=3378588 RepID=UPI003C35FE80
MSKVTLVSNIDKGLDSFLTVFATQNFLSSKSLNYGWFLSDNFLLPYFIVKKMFFIYIVFTNETIYLNQSSSIKDEEDFLNEVVLVIREKLPYIDFIIQSPTNVLFNIYPKGSIYCRFGSYKINLDQEDSVLFNNIHTKHKNVIRKAIKENIQIRKGECYKNISFELIQNTNLRQNLKPLKKDQFLRDLFKIKDSIEFYVAIKDLEVQGCAIIFWNKLGAYYMYGGSIENPYTGSLNLMHWEIIKDMKSKNVKLYDFVGARINPKKNSKLEGIQRFKSRFGGDMKIGYLWKYPIKVWKYNLFNFFKRINHIRLKKYYIGDVIDQELNLKTIFLTFDYELFFGQDSGTLDNSILKPTNDLLEVLRECGIVATFYVDAIYIERLLDYNLLDDYRKVKNQIQQMICQGHRVELHLHPHWYDAVYIKKDQKWQFNSYKNYRIQEFDSATLEHIFDKAIKLLYDIIHEVDKSYKFHSYRAGGFCIQPFSRISSVLKKHGIYIDSSVVYRYKSDSEAHHFDFTNMPNKDIYRFNQNILIEESNGEFCEFVCGTFNFNFIFKILNRILLKFSDSKIYGDGMGIEIRKNSFLSKFKTSVKVFSLECISSLLIKRLIRDYPHKNIVFVSHPKFLSRESFECLKEISNDNCFSNFKDFQDVQ